MVALKKALRSSDAPYVMYLCVGLSGSDTAADVFLIAAKRGAGAATDVLVLTVIAQETTESIREWDPWKIQLLLVVEIFFTELNEA